MNFISNWFQLDPLPSNMLHGQYDLSLVTLSYIVAVLTSYIAMNLTGQLRLEQNTLARVNWLAGGAFIMGAGFWSMHFIGMLAFTLPLPMEFDLGWISASLVISILACVVALYLLQKKNSTIIHLGIGGVLIGLGIAAMHYMGMEGIKESVNIRYLPELFLLSIVIAIVAAEFALWLFLHSNKGTYKKQALMKIIVAMVMGVAICGMHYIGMKAAIFTPTTSNQVGLNNIYPQYLAFFIAGIAILFIGLTMIASGYYLKLLFTVENEKKFLNAMLDNLDDGIIACDAQGNITVFNKALQKNIDFNKEGKTVDDLREIFNLNMSPEKRVSKEKEHLSRALNGEHIRGLVETLPFNNNKTREVVIDGQQIISADSTVLGAVLVIHDVTELKQTEKLKKEFVATVSHELRTPLTSIRGSLGLLVGGAMGEFPEKVNKLLQIANSNCDRLLLLISDILDIEKIEAGKMQYQLNPLDLVDLVKHAVDENQMYAEQHGVSLYLMHPKSSMKVIADSGRLMQVLANLISNACKFSSKGEEVVLKIKQYGEMVRVSVMDKGPGIPLEFQSRIFQKFSQADSSDSRRKGGTGLGLSISKAIIERFGGELKFISKPNEGATFYFDIPLAHEGVKSSSEVSSEIKVRTKRLLICDDDVDQSNFMKVLLESAGYYVDVSFSVAEARKLLAIHEYEALVLDLILPDKDGVAFIRELRASEKDATLPIVVVSVIAQTGRSMLNGEHSSVVDWLDKPVDFNTLLTAISKSSKVKQASGTESLVFKEKKKTSTKDIRAD